MTNSLAFAAVTAVLRDLLNDGLINHDVSGAVSGNILVSASPPDRVPVEGPPAGPRLNLFLYGVTPNVGWANAALPGRDAAGVRTANTPLALDLHYLLTAYGTEDLQSEILLGFGMHLLHETPVLSRAAIRAALAGAILNTNVLPPAFRSQAADDLASQVETVKITPRFLSTEEMSKLWTSFQARYRPSVAYVASVVLIAARKRTRSAPPVLERRVLATPFLRPTLDELEPVLAPPGALLTLRGSNLSSQGAEVTFNQNTPGAPTTLTPTEIRVPVPAALPAGIQTVRVRHPVRFGLASDPHRGLESNLLVFLLTPVITPVAGPVFTVPDGGTLQIQVAPALLPAQEVQLLVGDQAIPLPRRAPGSPPLTTVAFTLPAGTPSGLLLRLRVDGTESRLIVDTDTNSATYGQYIGPTLTVT